MSAETVNIDGLKIVFERRGRGSPLVLLHGYPLDRSIWNGVAPILEAEFDLIIPDMRGFGESDLMEADRSIIAYATDVAGLLERLDIRTAHVVGHSMGGYVALTFARLFPRLIAGLGLVASQELADSDERKAARRATAEQILRDGVASVADAMTPKLSPSDSVQATVRDIIGRQRPAGLALALDAMAGRPDSTDVLKSFSAPAVVVHGAADELIPVERGREMSRLLPAAHFLELPGVGHMPMLENPAAVAEALRFLGPIKSGPVKILDK